VKLCVAQGVIRGMNYLHTKTPAAIVHGDLKIQNVLVGEDYKAKVDIVSFFMQILTSFLPFYDLYAEILQRVCLAAVSLSCNDSGQVGCVMPGFINSGLTQGQPASGQTITRCRHRAKSKIVLSTFPGPVPAGPELARAFVVW